MNIEQKQQYKEAEAQLNASSARINGLKATALNAVPQEKFELYNRLEDLLIKERAAKVELAAWKHAQPDSWAAHRSKVESTLRALRDGLNALG